MNVLLINCPVREDAKPNVAPVGLGQIASTLKLVGHNVFVYDINGLRLTKEQVEEDIKTSSKNYDLIGISGLITTYKYQKWLIKMIKENSNTKIICGGGCASSVGELLKEAGADMIIHGEGENALLTVLDHNNILYSNIDEIPFPDWNKLPMDTYLENPIWGLKSNSSGKHKDMRQYRSMNMITSRGCPYSCNFCYDLFGKHYRQRSVENVMKEVAQLKERYLIDFIGFLDDNMFVNKKWIFDFCREMKKEKLLWGCHARVNEVDEEVLDKAYWAGCRWIGYGIESGSQTILDNMNKRVTVKQAKRAIEMTRDADIYPNTTFIYGYPGENYGTITETIEFCKDLGLKPDFFYATPYPMTELFNSHKNQIQAKFGGLEPFVEALGDAKDFVINLSGMPDSDFFSLREGLQEELK